MAGSALPTLPLSLTVPALTSLLAYLNAKHLLCYDLTLLLPLLLAVLSGQRRLRTSTLNLFSLLESRAHSHSHSSHPFLVYAGRSYTYAEAYENVLKYAAWLRARGGVQRGEIVAMDCMNSERFVWVWFALWSLGAVPAFVNYQLQGKGLEHCVRVSGAGFMVVDEEVARGRGVEEVLEVVGSEGFRGEGKRGVDVVVLGDELEGEILRMEGYRAPDEERAGIEGKGMSILIYTSGTTGLPKPAVVSWMKAFRAGYFVSSFLKLGKKERYYTCMPLYHSSAALLCALAVLQGGSTLVLGHKFHVSTFWDEVRTSKATIIQYVGETCRYLLSAPESPLDTTHNVHTAFGNGLRPDVWRRFQSRFNIATIAEFYAATETFIGVWNKSRNTFSEGAIGRNGTLANLVMGSAAALIVLDPETQTPLRDPVTGLCKRVATNVPGELLLRLDAKNIEEKFQGYHSDPQASEKKVLRDVFSKGDAWFATGDVMRRDHEDRWFFVDRIGDTYRWRSENVSTAEVAEVLGRHPDVKEVNVYGVEVPGYEGRAGCAAVVFRKEADSALLRSLREHLDAQLPKYAVPVFLRVTKEGRMEMTGTGKYIKQGLRDEGIDVGKSSSSRDRLLWLHDGEYVDFRDAEWKALNAGKARL